MAEYIFNDNNSNNGIDNNYQSAPDRNATVNIPGGSSYSPLPPKKEKKKGGHTGLICALCAVCIVLSGFAGFGGAMIAGSISGSGSSGTGSTGGSGSGGSSGSGITNVAIVTSDSDRTAYVGTPAEVAAAVKDTVVEITTEIVTTSSYFGQYITSGAGSGVIINSDGYIITNYHVIESATSITVRTTDGTEYKASVVGSDEDADIAVLKVDATGLLAAKLGNSSSLVVGEQVLAIGNPLGKLGGSVTVGYISALDREITVDGKKMTLLQTDTSINPGNSGGGLFNLAGELVGVVNAKSSGSGIEGLGFAIPIDSVSDTIEQLLEYGYVRGKAFLGIKTMDVSSLSAYLYYSGYTNTGVYITSSNLNTALKSMDRVISIDGKEIQTTSDINTVLAEHAVGDTLTVTVARGGKTVDVTVTCYEKTPENISKAG